MKKLIKIITLGFAISLLTACGEPKLDTSSKESINTSMQEMMVDLSPEKQQKFKKTVVGLYMLAAFTSAKDGVTKEDVMAEVSSKLDGKTVDEIFEVAAEVGRKLKK